MRLLHFNKNSQGFTLAETMIIVIIIGILTALAAPSFLGMSNKAKVNNAVNTVRGALQEAQRQAVNKSKRCTITVNANSITSGDGCLLTGARTLPTGINLTVIDGNPSNCNPSNCNPITYGIRGNTIFSNPSSTTIKFIISLADGSGKNKCLEVSTPLGIIRSGSYDGTNCNLEQ